MTLGRKSLAPHHPELIRPACGWCHHFPCLCLRSAPCACGGVVLARDDDAIAHAVRAHNDSPAHTAWAIAAGWR